MDLEAAVASLKKELRDNPRLKEVEEQVISKYGELFKLENIDNLTKEQFMEFLDIKNNHHWTIHRHNNHLTEDMESLHRSLKILLNEDEDLEKRIKKICADTSSVQQKYFKEGTFSPILLVTNPRKYPVYNGTVREAFKKLGIEIKESDPIWHKYPKVQKIIAELALKHGLTLWQIDWLWWRIIGSITFEDLKKFIQQDMQMQENYQPVVIKTLILEGGIASSEIIKESLLKYNESSPSNSMYNTVIKVLDNRKIIRREEGEIILNIIKEMTDVEEKEIIKLCDEKINEFSNINEDKIAICWPTDKDENKIELFADAIQEYGKTLWGVRWNISDSVKSQFPIKGYIYYKQKIIGIANITNFTSAEETKEDLSQRPEIQGYEESTHFLHIDSIKRCEPFPYTQLEMWDSDKELPPAPWQRIYVKEIKNSELENYWKISPGAEGEDWATQQSKGLTGIHFVDFGDLTGITEEELKEKIRIEYKESSVSAKVINTFIQIRDFLKIKEGDVIVANKGKSKILGLGKVVGPYKYRPELKHPHTFPVEWYDTVESSIPKQEGWMITVIPLKKEDFEKITKDRTNYLLLRYNPNKNTKWSDVFGEKYIFGKKANYKKVVRGTKAIWFDRQNGEYCFWGYGEVSSVIDDGESITATFDDFVQLGESETSPKKWTLDIEHKITKSPGFNIQNSILQINEEIYNKIVSDEIILDPADEPLSFPHETLESARIEIKKQLLIDDQTIDKIVASLYSGKNVLLTGPVGTGKTHLAQLLPKLVWDEVGGYYPETVTATSDWTTQDVIGGIFPKVKDADIAYIVQKGCVSDTVSRNWENKNSKSQKRVPISINGTNYKGVWLVIDEFNRANIDRAFGQLFTALEYNELKIPTTDIDKEFEILKIPKDYRIIGTLNTFDKHFLFRISDALKRRFSFIEILPPAYKDNKEEKRFVVEKAIDEFEHIQNELNIYSYQDVINDKNLVIVLDNLYDIMAFIRLSKNLGTALLISIFRLTLINYLTTKDWDKSLDYALTTSLLPQMESLHYWQLDSVMNFVGGRIQEMFRKYDVNKKPDVDRYEEELKNLAKYLKISNINKDAPKLVSKFRSGEMMSLDNLDELNPWQGKIKPVLKEFRTGLEALKKEKGYFDDDESQEYEE